MKGKREGYGKYFWNSGEYYIGQWKNNLPNEKGFVFYSNGNVNWINDVFVPE